MWPLAGLPRPLNTELRLPSYFKNTAELIGKEDIPGKYNLGKNKEKILETIKKHEDAGFTHLYFHNIGPHQEEFIKWVGKEIIPDIL